MSRQVELAAVQVLSGSRFFDQGSALAVVRELARYDRELPWEAVVDNARYVDGRRSANPVDASLAASLYADLVEHGLLVQTLDDVRGVVLVGLSADALEMCRALFPHWDVES